MVSQGIMTIYGCLVINMFFKEGKMNIILFDGVCNLCSFGVQFIIKREKNTYFHFSSLQSDAGKALVEKYKLENVDSIIFIENDSIFTYSSAVLEIAKYLDGGWKYAYVLRFVPKFIRDFIYKMIASYRYQMFGKKDVCMLPSEKYKERFL